MGAGVAWGLLIGIHQFLYEVVNQQPDFIQFVVNGLRLTSKQTILLPSSLLGLGCAVGLMGSLVAVRKYALR